MAAFYLHVIIQSLMMLSAGSFPPVCRRTQENVSNTGPCYLLHLTSVEYLQQGWEGKDDLTPGVEYWTDAVVTYTPWIKYGGCHLTSTNDSDLETTGTMFSLQKPITSCLEYSDSSTFYISGSRCIVKDFETFKDETCDAKACSPMSRSLCWTSRDNDKCVCRYEIVHLLPDNLLDHCKSVFFRYVGNTLWNLTLESKFFSPYSSYVCFSGNEGGHNYTSHNNLTDLNRDVRVCSLYRGDFLNFNYGNEFLKTLSQQVEKFARNQQFWVFREERIVLKQPGYKNALRNANFSCVSAVLTHNRTLSLGVRKCDEKVLGFKSPSQQDNKWYLWLVTGFIVLSIGVVMIAAMGIAIRFGFNRTCLNQVMLDCTCTKSVMYKRPTKKSTSENQNGANNGQRLRSKPNKADISYIKSVKCNCHREKNVSEKPKVCLNSNTNSFVVNLNIKGSQRDLRNIQNGTNMSLNSLCEVGHEVSYNVSDMSCTSFKTSCQVASPGQVSLICHVSDEREQRDFTTDNDPRQYVNQDASCRTTDISCNVNSSKPSLGTVSIVYHVSDEREQIDSLSDNSSKHCINTNESCSLLDTNEESPYLDMKNFRNQVYSSEDPYVSIHIRDSIPPLESD